MFIVWNQHIGVTDYTVNNYYMGGNIALYVAFSFGVVENYNFFKKPSFVNYSL